MRRTKEDAEKTRKAILQAAEMLFLEKGVAHTSLDLIAHQAGVTRGAVYWHFQSKAHLFYEMLNQVCLPPEHPLAQLEGESAFDSLLTLRDLCTEALEGLARDEQKRRTVTILLFRCEFTEELREAELRYNSAIKQLVVFYERFFTRAHDRGLLYSAVSPALAARTLHALLIGLCIDWLCDSERFDLLRDAQMMVDALFRGLLLEWNL